MFAEGLKIAAYNFVASLSVHYLQVLLPSVDSILTVVNLGLLEEVSPEVKVAVLSMLEKCARSMPKCSQLSNEKLFTFWHNVSVCLSLLLQFACGAITLPNSPFTHRQRSSVATAIKKKALI